MMIIQFNPLGVITSVDTSNASFRQGSKGEVIQAVFADKSNSTHVAKINFTRPDGTAVQNLIMSPDPSNQSAFLFELDDLWFLAISGNATMTIFLYNASNVIQAQGQVTIPIESTDYDGEPTITITQYDSLLAALARKLGMPSSSLRVDELPEIGIADIFYVVHDDPNDTTRVNIYVWNSTTREYIWVGSNELDLNKYYTEEQGQAFEEEIDQRITNVENTFNGSPKGVYATLEALQTAYPTGTTGIYVVSGNGHWYYWNGSAWADGGAYQTSQGIVPNTRKVGIADLQDDITNDELVESVTDYEFDNPSELNDAYLEQSVNKYNPALQTTETISPHYYVDGYPYSETTYDTAWNCTNVFKIKPNTTYYIKVFGISADNGKPWGYITNGIFFYDKNMNYISKSGDNSFTTPTNAVFARFNYRIFEGMSLGKLNLSCMLVESSTEPSEYIAYKHETAIEKSSKNEGLALTIGDELTDFEVFDDDDDRNVYNASAWTESNVVSGKVYQNGIEIGSQYGAHTGFFEILPNTQYTIGLVPVFGSCTLPSYDFDVVMSFFDTNKNYLGQVLKTQPTFTTPKGTKYAIVNLQYNIDGITFEIVNGRCVIYKGGTLPSTYKQYKPIVETKDKIYEINDTLEDYDEHLYSYQIIDNLSYTYNKCWTLFLRDFFDAGWAYTIIDLSQYDIKSFNAKTVTNHNCPGLVFFNGDPLNGGTYIGKALAAPKTGTEETVVGTDIAIPEGCTHVLYQYIGTYASQVYILGKQFINLDSVNQKAPIYATWSKTNTKLTANTRFDANRDLVIELGKRGPNNIFDFKTWSFVQNSENTYYPLVASTGQLYKSNGTDFFGPWIVGVVNNKNGDNVGSGYFTGGNHNYINTGSMDSAATGRTVSVEVRIDGSLCDSFNGYCSRIDIYWVNRVQSYDTTKQDGSGREVIEERYHMSFDGHTWKVEGNPIALEDISARVYYGLQFSTFGTLGATNKIEYYGDDKDSKYATNETSQSSSKNCLGMFQNDVANNFRLKMFIDTSKGAGRGGLNTYDYSAFYNDYGKGYCNLINGSSGKAINEGESIYFEGSYTFEPILDGE